MCNIKPTGNNCASKNVQKTGNCEQKRGQNNDNKLFKECNSNSKSQHGHEFYGDMISFSGSKCGSKKGEKHNDYAKDENRYGGCGEKRYDRVECGGQKGHGCHDTWHHDKNNHKGNCTGGYDFNHKHGFGDLTGGNCNKDETPKPDDNFDITTDKDDTQTGVDTPIQDEDINIPDIKDETNDNIDIDKEIPDEKQDENKDDKIDDEIDDEIDADTKDEPSCDELPEIDRE